VLLEAVEELFVDIRKELHLRLNGGIRLYLIEGYRSILFLSWFALHHHHATTILGFMIIELHGDVLLLLGLIANERQGHEERACHEDHGAKVRV
jgi:hypothetical protein